MKKTSPSEIPVVCAPDAGFGGGINNNAWSIVKHSYNDNQAWEIEKQTALGHVAKTILEQNWKLFMRLIRGGAPIHVLWTTPDSRRITLLAYAAQLGREKAVEELLRRGADADGRTPEGETALFLALQMRQTSIAQKLLIGGARASLKVKNMPPLTLCVQNSYSEGVRLLLEWRANPNALDSEKKTPLYHNLKKQPPNPEDVVIGKMLLEAGANPDRLDQHGTNARNLDIDMAQSALLDHNDMRNQAKTILKPDPATTADPNKPKPPRQRL